MDAYRILLVEQQEGLRVPLERALRLFRYDVLAVSTVAGAKAALLDDRIDLLLSDVTLEATSGFELALWARALRPGLPILLISGMALFFAPAELRNDPAVRLVAKPFQIAKLMADVAELLAWRSSGATDISES